MSATEDPNSIEAVRTDIEATQADLVETVNELSDRLNPANRVAAVTQRESVEKWLRNNYPVVSAPKPVAVEKLKARASRQ